MASKLSVTISAVDDLSSKLSSAGKEADKLAEAFRKTESTADSAIDAVTDGSQDMEKAMEAVAGTIEGAVNDALQKAADQAGMTVDEIIEEIQKAPDAMEEFTQTFQEGFDQAVSGAEDAGEAMEKLEDSMEDAEDGAEDLGDQLKKTGEKGEDSGDKIAGAMQGVESLLAAAGIVKGINAIFDALGECAAQAEALETAMAKLQTIAGEKYMSQLTGEIMELSSATGVAATDLADVAYNAISAGTSVEKSVGMAATATKLATAGFTDSASALSVLTTSINAYGAAAGTAEEIADSLITVQNLGVTTVADLSANMGKAIATASAYNVSLDNLESAYISITKAGINTAEGTTYVSSMLKELGTEGSDVAKTLKEETGQSFAQLMASGYSLADVLGILYDSCNQDATALMNLWGSAEAGKASNALVSQGLSQFNDNLVTLQNSAGATASAYEVMAQTTEFAHQKMQNSMTNLQAVVGQQLNPALKNLYEAGAGVTDWFASVLEDCPGLTYLLTGLAAGVSTLAVVVVGYTAATKIASIVTALFATEAEKAALKTALITGAIGAAVVAVGVIIALFASAADEEKNYTGTTRELADEISDLSEEHERAVEAYGENSAAAQDLQTQINVLTEEYEKSKKSLEDYYNEVDSLVKSHDEIIKDYNESEQALEDQSSEAQRLTTRLKELAGSSDRSAKSQGQMEMIVRRLNQLYPSLGLTIDDVNGNLDGLIERVNLVGEATKRQRAEAAMETYDKLSAEYESLIRAQEEAEKVLAYARRDYANQNWAAGTWNELWGSGATKDLQKAQDNLAIINEKIAEQQAALADCEEQYSEYLKMQNGEELVDAYNAVDEAIEQTRESVKKLREDYYKAYDSALSSIQGQWKLWEELDSGVDGPWKLWEKVEKQQKVSLKTMEQNMQDQLDYWNQYQDTIDSLHERHIAGLDDMVSAMNDGSQEAAAYLQQMSKASDEELTKMVNQYQNLQNAQSVSLDDMKTSMQKQMQFWQEYADSLENLHKRNIKGLDELVASMDDGSAESAQYLKLMSQASDEELTNMAKQYESLQKAQQDTATDVAELAVSYDDRMKAIEQTYTETIEGMKMDSEARTAAEETMKAYLDGIKLYMDQAIGEWAALEDAARRATSIKPSGDSSGSSDSGSSTRKTTGSAPTAGGVTYVGQHAEGTLDSEPIYIAGEEGPELIVSGGHDTVFPAAETEKIITMIRSQGSAERSESSKTITLNINGSGSIQIDKNVDKEKIWDDVKDTIKSNLFEILADEIYEGSDQVYEY